LKKKRKTKQAPSGNHCVGGKEREEGKSVRQTEKGKRKGTLFGEGGKSLGASGNKGKFVGSTWCRPRRHHEEGKNGRLGKGGEGQAERHGVEGGISQGGQLKYC